MDFSLINIELSEGLSSVGDLLVGIAAIWAVFQGTKSLGRYLQDEDMKERVNASRRANQETHEVAISILKEIDTLSSLAPDGDAFEFEKVYSKVEDWLKKLDESSRYASSNIQTPIYVVQSVLKGVNKVYRFDKKTEKGFVGSITWIAPEDLIRVMRRLCHRITHSALQTQVIPKTLKRSLAWRIKHWYSNLLFSKSHTKPIEYPFGLDLRFDSRLHYEIYHSSFEGTHPEFFKSRWVQSMGDNTPIVMSLLLYYKVYVPPVLKFARKEKSDDSDALEFLESIHQPLFLCDIKGLNPASQKESDVVLYFSTSNLVSYDDPKHFAELVSSRYFDPITNRTLKELFPRSKVSTTGFKDITVHIKSSDLKRPIFEWLRLKRCLKRYYRE